MKTYGQAQILHDYQHLEADGADTWNPLKMDGELAHRLALMTCLVFALRRCHKPIQELNVLDYGCGNGRSTRMFLDLGLTPGQLQGIDIRPGAIQLASSLHPSIPFQVASTFDPAWNLINVCTVFSSIRHKVDRQSLADHIQSQIPKNGQLFYFDLVRTNQFAGNEIIAPTGLFRQLNLCWRFKFKLDRFEKSFRVLKDESQVTLRKWLRRNIRRLLLRWTYTHESYLFKKVDR